jgi:DNA-directed RNA polymerase subunit H (RpoH/RPB5)
MEATKSIKKNLVQVTMTSDQIKETVLLNIVKMLVGRGIVSPNHIDNYKTIAYNNLDQNDVTFFQLESDEAEKLGSKTVNIKFINRKITTIRKVIDIETFMDIDGYKFVIVNNIAPKAVKQITDYKQTELFYDYELLINLIDHILVPKHNKLNELEKQFFMVAYQISETDLKNLKRMYIDDPVARYYKLSVGDIVKIERPSLTSGISIDYRYVTSGSINK